MPHRSSDACAFASFQQYINVSVESGAQALGILIKLIVQESKELKPLYSFIQQNIDKFNQAKEYNTILSNRKLELSINDFSLKVSKIINFYSRHCCYQCPFDPRHCGLCPFDPLCILKLS